MLWDNEIMPLADSLIGRTLANYHIERLLGRGGMASVFYGFDFQLQRPAAIKVIDERYSGDTSYSTRFVHEARAMASWRHPNIPQIYQAGVENGIYFYAMEYIQGMDLEELLRHYVQKGKLLPFKDVLLYGKAIAEALDYTHLNGAIHRDVKPSNILISEDGRILLTDFGLVLELDKGTKGEVFGSPRYIAPEQARSSADAVPQSDLYSLGVILYEMVVGRLPFEDQSPASLAIKHITLEPPAPRQLNPDLSPEVEAVLLKALRKNPQERYQTGKDLMSALEKGIGGQFGGIRNLHSVALPPATLPFLLIEPQDQPQPTNLELRPTGYKPTGTNLQSPSPAIRNLEPGIPGVVKQLFMPLRKKRVNLAAILTVSYLAILCIFLLVRAWLFGGLNGPAPGSTAQPSSTALAFQSQLTSTVATVNAAIASTIPATIEPSPTSNVSEFRLMVSLQKSDSILVINQGTAGVPLAQLRFGFKKGKFTGDEWGIDVLQPGQCVTVLKQEGHSQPPTGTQCEIVGKLLTQSGSNKFWDTVFDVYFQNVLVASCDVENDSCKLQFSNFPQ